MEKGGMWSNFSPLPTLISLSLSLSVSRVQPVVRKAEKGMKSELNPLLRDETNPRATFFRSARDQLQLQLRFFNRIRKAPNFLGSSEWILEESAEANLTTCKCYVQLTVHYIIFFQGTFISIPMTSR